ncbi:MAG: bifunctional hydroxymethylpyrimidine kinase/phosphomethylpyrimidine kinase [Roseburia sp.]|nr:bifunctional hydroxymethylpyrimidine kinase/phosphomethylpyrimidine kinase [Roseburia sp.]
MENSKRKTALTIAGSDSSGGAGIQADIKTMLANGVYAMSAVTALTAQNTCGVAGIMEVTPEFLTQQMEAVFTDIYPDAVKIGMVMSAELIHVIGETLRKYQAKNIVLDPVMISTSGHRLMEDDAIEAMERELFPLASLITPNIPEAEAICGWEITGSAAMERAAAQIRERYGCAVLLKGGHAAGGANDVLWQGNKPAAGSAGGAAGHAGSARWYRGRRIDNPNTHGTGCTLSSAIASNLAKGVPLDEAVALAKEYLSGAIAAMLDLGAGSGPLDHGYRIDKGISFCYANQESRQERE